MNQSSTRQATAESIVDRIVLPEGFRIELYARNVEGARSLTLGEKGTLFVGSRKTGRLYAVIDRDKNHQADRVIVLDQGMNMPNGVAFRKGSLYVAEVNRVLRYDDIESRLDDPPDPVVVNDSFPTESHHGWKFIAFGPDDRLYVPIGAPCNICDPEDPRFATITRMDPDGKNFEIFAHGVRNTVGFDWHPNSDVLWFTDNGRDWLGDNRPPDELNNAPEKGLHFGFPYWHGRNVIDPKYGEGHRAEEFRPPAQELGPHVAALGMRFYTGDMFPEAFRNQIFIAEHGSWNRSTKIGYRVSLVRLEGNHAVSYETFARGWHDGPEVFGRPVDVLVMPDGSLLISDDYAGLIYRVSYRP